MLITTLPAGTKLDERLIESKWSADAVDRMAELCRGTGVRLGLVTNGDLWALVDAPVGGATGVATWDASLWMEERLTLDAFTTLLGVRRFFSVADSDTLEAMLSESANAEAEVTDQLGKQVRAAVELLVDAMSRANRDHGGHLFDDLSTADVYEAAVTVMMRLVFLLSAEERGLFLLGDETYDSTYAVSTLRAQLEEEANTYGEEVIARRTDAWHRLLATFRMVFGGARHENLRLPAYGGSLFDPDVVRVTAEAGSSFLDRMIEMIEGARRQKTPNEIALNIVLVSLTALFIVVVFVLPPFAHYNEAQAIN